MKPVIHMCEPVNHQVKEYDFSFCSVSRSSVYITFLELYPLRHIQVTLLWICSIHWLLVQHLLTIVHLVVFTGKYFERSGATNKWRKLGINLFMFSLSL